MSRKKRQRASWGSIADLGDGSWRLRWWDSSDGTYKRRTEMVHGTRRDASRRLAEIHAGTPDTPRKRNGGRELQGITVEQAYERWWLPKADERLASGDLSRNTYRNYKTRWKRNVHPAFGSTRCIDVRPLDVQHWLDGMTQKPAVDSLAILRQILDLAVLYEVCDTNKARSKYSMPKSHEDRKDGAYTLAELDQIAQAAEDIPTEAAMLLMCFGSCRTGESLGVKLDEVHQVHSHGLMLVTAEIVRQVQSDASISEDGVLKNRQSVRTVVVPPPWSGRLWKLAQDARARGDVWLSDDGTHRPLGQNRLRRDWKATVAKAGLPARQPRAARRSWETFMRWDMEVERSKIEQLMGHALAGVTGEHYDRPDPQAFVDVVAEAFARKPFRRT